MRPSIVVAAAAAAFAAGAAFAKLPAPSDEEKAKAAETANKAAWNEKVAAYKLCQSMDRVAAAYRGHAGKAASAPEQTPACADPGPYSALPITPPSSKPLETSGAHSPPGAAATPPSTNATSADMTGPRK